MSSYFGYLDDEFRFIDGELEEDDYDRLEASVDSGCCAVCGRTIGDWGSDMEKFLELTDEYPMPVNVCFKCASKAYRNGRF